MQTVPLLFACLFSIAPLVDCAKVSSTSYATLVMEDDDEVRVVNSTPGTATGAVATKAVAATPTTKEEAPPVAVSIAASPKKIAMSLGHSMDGGSDLDRPPPPRPEFNSEEDWEKFEQESVPEDARETLMELDWDATPKCKGQPGQSPCEKRTCESRGTRKKDKRPCAKKNCYCRCVVMTTGGRYCDEWVAEGCTDNDGCFRAEDFGGLLLDPAQMNARGELPWREKHVEVVWTAAFQQGDANKAWRRKVVFEDHLMRMLQNKEIARMIQLTQQRFDLPTFYKAKDLEKLATKLLGGNITSGAPYEEYVARKVNWDAH